MLTFILALIILFCVFASTGLSCIYTVQLHIHKEQKKYKLLTFYVFCNLVTVAFVYTFLFKLIN